MPVEAVVKSQNLRAIKAYVLDLSECRIVKVVHSGQGLVEDKPLVLNDPDLLSLLLYFLNLQVGLVV